MYKHPRKIYLKYSNHLCVPESYSSWLSKNENFVISPNHLPQSSLPHEHLHIAQIAWINLVLTGLPLEPLLQLDLGLQFRTPAPGSVEMPLPYTSQHEQPSPRHSWSWFPTGISCSGTAQPCHVRSWNSSQAGPQSPGTTPLHILLSLVVLFALSSKPAICLSNLRVRLFAWLHSTSPPIFRHDLWLFLFRPPFASIEKTGVSGDPCSTTMYSSSDWFLGLSKGCTEPFFSFLSLSVNTYSLLGIIFGTLRL